MRARKTDQQATMTPHDTPNRRRRGAMVGGAFGAAGLLAAVGLQFAAQAPAATLAGNAADECAAKASITIL
jgi:hypothetical protein